MRICTKGVFLVWLCFNWKCKINQCWDFHKVVISTLTNLIWVSNSKIILCAILCLSYIPPKMTVDLRFMEIYFFPWCMLQINLSWPWLELFFPVLWNKNLANYSKNRKICTRKKKKSKFRVEKKNHSSWPKARRKLVWHYLIVKFLHIWADYILN